MEKPADPPQRTACVHRHVHTVKYYAAVKNNKEEVYALISIALQIKCLVGQKKNLEHFIC
jgi:hypothetical protein